MQEPIRPTTGPTVVHIRMRGRTLTFATGVTLFALLPFLGGSAPQLERQSVVLAAGAAAAVPAAPSIPAPAYPQGVTPEMSGSLSGLSSAIGGGLFQFPGLSLSPTLAPALGSLLPGQQAEMRFIHPVPGGLSSTFGPRMHPVLGVPMFHTGIDLAAACGTPIRAAASGTVVYAEVSASWGARTIIEHSPTLKTAYGHQSKFLVKEGDVVKQGDIIGLVGTTGWSTGCHLHFDVILDDRYVDPAPYLGLPSSHAPSIPFLAAPHVVRDDTGRPFHTVEDGDVPIPSPTSSSTPSSQPSGSTTPSPSDTSSTTAPPTRDPTTTDPTTDPTTTDPTTTDPTTDPTTTDPTTDPTTTDPTTTAPAPSTTSEPTTTNATTAEPAPSTTSEPTTTNATTAEPAPSTTSEPTTTNATTAEPAPSTTSEPTTTNATTAEPAPSTTSEPAATTAPSEPATTSDVAEPTTASATASATASTD
ncbi:M23 family metallopeptidase [Intrasporangium calvum]|uniref:M23 family metallopeptidase n=1 Tax=Intrasporangium calvum TaxID=53358 RepID=UPI000DF61921|nr:M23 family metallopeptidase [Intrasporangium calvum]AXG13621.1 M23 family peptidase [Intrasporangium calvum]